MTQSRWRAPTATAPKASRVEGLVGMDFSKAVEGVCFRLEPVCHAKTDRLGMGYIDCPEARDMKGKKGSGT